MRTATFGGAANVSARRPVSRVLSLADQGMAIHLGRKSPCASRDLPGRRPGNRPAGRPARRPYLVLLPVGFAVPVPLPRPRCALAAPFHPCRPEPARGRSGLAVSFLWHFPWGRPRRALPGTVSPWSPDFPPPAGLPPLRKAAIRPSDPAKVAVRAARVNRRRRRPTGSAGMFRRRASRPPGVACSGTGTRPARGQWSHRRGR